MTDVEVYGFAVGHIPLFPRLHKGCKEALDIIKEQEGLIGFIKLAEGEIFYCSGRKMRQ